MQKKQKIHKIKEKIKELIDQMDLKTFKNNKRYSFDYKLKETFDKIEKEAKTLLEIEENKNLPIQITNAIPIFLPKETRRIAFFQSTSKSVRRIPTNNIIKALQRNSHNYDIPKNDPRDINTILQDDIAEFKAHLEEYEHYEYFIDTFSTSIRFNSYDKNDKLLLEKSYVRGGLVFNMKEEEFEKNAIVTYPNYRKKRKDIVDDYLNLSLLKIRPIL